MADPADPIKSAVETLQRALKTYGDYEGPIDGVLTPELYETLSTFTSSLKGVSGVATILNHNEITIDGIYDSELGQALTEFFSGPQLQALRTAVMAGDSGAQIAQFLLRQANAPDAFVEDPQLLLQLIDQDLAGIVSAMDTLEEAGELDGPPQALTDEQRNAQPEAIQALEAQVKTDLQFYRDTAQASMDAVQAQIDALPDDATEETKAGLNAQLEAARKTVVLLDSGLEGIKDQEPDQDFDDNYEEALRVYVEFLQRGNNLTAYLETPVEAGQPLVATDVLDGSGGYSEEYRTFLKTRMENLGERLETLTEKGDEREPAEELEFQLITRTTALNTVMDAMIESGAYVPPAPGEPPREVLPMEEARPVIEQAIGHMVRNGKVELDPVLDVDGEAQFDRAGRMALQAFLIDLKGFLDIDVDDESGLYSTALHEALQQKLADDAIRRRVADEYFNGDQAMVAQLLPAMNTYLEEFPAEDDLGFPYSFAEDVLITKPELREGEAEMMLVAINRAPDDELLAMNEMMITLTGYGMEDILPDGSFSDEQKQRLEIGGDRAEILGELYAKVRQEAQDALIRDGRPMSDLEGEIQDRLVERFNNLVDDNAAFDIIRAEYMRNYLREGVKAALAAETAIEGGPDVSRAAGMSAFVSKIPGAEEFGASHGPNMRAYFLIDPETIEGVTPEVMRNFGSQSAQTSATLDAAMNAQTVDGLITDMTEDFDRLTLSDVAMRTVREVREDLADKQSLFENIYNDPRNAGAKLDNGALLVSDQNGETVLLSQGADGLEVRYLSALGIGSIEGVDESQIVKVGEEFDLDALLIRTASAGYQSINQGAEWKSTHNPEFFEMGGKYYVVGMDKGNNTIRVVEMDQDFMTASNAARRVYSLAGPAGRAATSAEFMRDPAYKFLTDNYDRQFASGGSADRIFQFMLQQMDTDEATQALNVMGEYSMIDFDNLPTLDDAPLLEDGAPGYIGLAMVYNARPEDVKDKPFVYLREGDDGSQQIFVLMPALKEERTTNEDGTETVQMVTDLDAPPVIRDISDPAMYQSMRDLFIQLEVIPGEALESDPAFQEVRDWLLAGGRPPLREAPPPPPVYAAPSAESVQSLFNNAAAFEAQGRNIEFGAPITDVNLLHDVLGYDPHAAFASRSFSDPENAYVVHGIEPGIWEGSADHHEFLSDHFLITTMKDGEIVTYAMSKDDVNNNPFRIEDLLYMEHDYEREVNFAEIPNPSVYVANRDGINTTAEGTSVPIIEFKMFSQLDLPRIIERPLVEGDPYYGQIETQGFWSDQSWWDNRVEWNRDLTLWRREVSGGALDAPIEPAAPEAPSPTPAPEADEEASAGMSLTDMLADNRDDMTIDRTGAAVVETAGIAPSVIRPDA